MKKPDYILEELNIISPIIGKMKKIQPYSVPSAYFKTFSIEILDRIKANKEHAFSLKSYTPFSIPNNYFKNFPDLMLEKAMDVEKRNVDVFDELNQIAPILNTISKKPVFYTPANFFDKVQLPPASSGAEEARVKLINKRIQFARFAAAAVIIPSVIIGLFTLTGKDFRISRSNINNAKNALKHLSKEEIVSFLRDNTSYESTTSTMRNKPKHNTIKSSLKRIPDKEIQQFLKESGESDEI
jgi:hypothetical protein